MAVECAIHAACEARFFSDNNAQDTQFARDLLTHLDRLHQDGRLTAQFLRIAFDALARSTPVDTQLQAAMDGALACVAAREQQRGT